MLAAKVNQIVENAMSDKEALEQLVSLIKQELRASVALVDCRGKILVLDTIEQTADIAAYLETINEKLLAVKRIQQVKGFFNTEKYNCFALPLVAISQRLGTLLVYSQTKEFTADSFNSVNEVITAISLIVMAKSVKNSQAQLQGAEVVKAALGSLSFSELNAVIAVVSQLTQKDNNLIVASKLSEQTGITRSIIVTALKKLESAGIIESRSRGMRGTCISVTNQNIFEQVRRLKME